VIFAGYLVLIVTRMGERKNACRVLARKAFAERYLGNREGSGSWVGTVFYWLRAESRLQCVVNWV
jgi:hypothetical protein